MEVICLEEPAFYQLIEKVFARINDEKNIKEPLWLSGTEAMKKLHITSKTTLFKIRDEGEIRFSYASPASSCMKRHLSMNISTIKHVTLFSHDRATRRYNDC